MSAPKEVTVYTAQPGSWLSCTTNGLDDALDLSRPLRVVTYADYKDLTARLAAAEARGEATAQRFLAWQAETLPDRMKLAAAERDVARYRALVESAYREGFFDGFDRPTANDERTEREAAWLVSETVAALNATTEATQ